jgi:hypothetical protein
VKTKLNNVKELDVKCKIQNQDMRHFMFCINYNDIFGSKIVSFAKQLITPTFIAVSHCEEVDIVTLAVEEEEADP